MNELVDQLTLAIADGGRGDSFERPARRRLALGGEAGLFVVTAPYGLTGRPDASPPRWRRELAERTTVISLEGDSVPVAIADGVLSASSSAGRMFEVES